MIGCTLANAHIEKRLQRQLSINRICRVTLSTAFGSA